MENPHEQVQNALLSRIISNMVSIIISNKLSIKPYTDCFIGKLE